MQLDSVDHDPGLTPSDPLLDSNPVPLVTRYQNLQLELVQMRNALDTAFTPGHDALTAQCERAEARAKIADADLKATLAKEESAKMEGLVLKARLENESKTRATMQMIINDKATEVDLLKRRIKALNLTGKSLKQKNTELESAAKDSSRKALDSQRVLTKQKETIKEMEAKMKKSVTTQKKIQAKVEKLTRLNTATRSACATLEKRLKEERMTARNAQKDAQQQLHLELQRVKALEDERDSWKRQAEEASQGLRIEKSRSDEERASAKKTQNDIQRLLDLELQRVKTLEDERDSWKREALETSRRLRIENERSSIEEEVPHAYILPSPQALIDGNKDVLLSPAPLARKRQLTPPSSSESGTIFLPLPYPDDERSVEFAESPAPAGATEGATDGETNDVQASTPGRGRSPDFSGTLFAHTSSRKSRALSKALENACESGQRIKRKRTSQKNATETHGPAPPGRPTKLQKVEKKSAPGKNGTETKKGSSRQLEKADTSGATVERKAGGRTLRNRRPVSYDYDEAGRDIAITAPGFEVDWNEVAQPTRSKARRQPVRRVN